MDNIKSRNYEFIQEFSNKYTFLYDDYSERFGKLKVYECIEKNCRYHTIALKEVEVQAVEDKIKCKQLQAASNIEDFIDDFIAAVEKVIDNQMNNHNSILQIVAYQCKGLSSHSTVKFKKIIIYYEYYQHNLMQEAKRQYCYNSLGFTENELWQILFNLCSVMAFLEGQNRWVGDLISENIFYDQIQKQIKISPYKMSPIDDIKKQYIYVKLQNQSQINTIDYIQFQQSNHSSYNISKYFKSDTLYLGLSLLRVMTCNDMFSFEVFEQMKKGYIEQNMIQTLLQKSESKYGHFLTKVLSVMTDENEQSRPSGKDIYKLLNQYSDLIKQGKFDASHISEFSLLKDNGVSYDFKKSPSLYASLKYSQIIRKNNSFALDEKETQEDENNRMQKILDSVKKIINKKAINDFHTPNIKGQNKSMIEEMEERGDKINNDTYESLTELTAKESIADLQQIIADNITYSNRTQIVPSFPVLQKMVESKNTADKRNSNNQQQFNFDNSSQLYNQSQGFKNITNTCDNNRDKKYSQILRDNLNKSIPILQIDKDSFLPKQNNYKVLQNQNDYSKENDNSSFKHYQMNTTFNINNNHDQNKNYHYDTIQKQKEEKINQQLSNLHQKQLETIQLAQKELEKIKGDIQELTLQRANLLDQNKRLMQINNELINQNKEKAVMQNKCNKPNEIEALRSDRSKQQQVVQQNRQNETKLDGIQNQCQTSSQYSYTTNSPILTSVSQPLIRKVSQTPLQAIQRRELKFPQRHSSQPTTSTQLTIQTPMHKESQSKQQNLEFQQKADFILLDDASTKKDQQGQLLQDRNVQSSQYHTPKCEITQTRKNSLMSTVSNCNQQQVVDQHIYSTPESRPLNFQVQQSAYQLSKIVSNNFTLGQETTQKPLGESHINEDVACKMEINNGKCINIYQIKSPCQKITVDMEKCLNKAKPQQQHLTATPPILSNKQQYNASVNLSPQLYATPLIMTAYNSNCLSPITNPINHLNVEIKQKNEYDSDRYSILNHQNITESNSKINNKTNPQISQLDERRKQTKNQSYLHPVNQQDNEEIETGESNEHKSNRIKSSSMQMFYPLHIHRQSRIAQQQQSNNKIEHAPISSKLSQLNPNPNMSLSSSLKPKELSNKQLTFQPIISENEQIIVKKSNSLPRPAPTQCSSSSKESNTDKLSLTQNSSTYQKNKFNIEFKPAQNNTNNQNVPLPRQNNDLSYAIVHRKQNSLIDPSKFGQVNTLQNNYMKTDIKQVPSYQLQKYQQSQYLNQSQLKTLPNNEIVNNISQQPYDRFNSKGFTKVQQNNTPTTSLKASQLNSQLSSQSDRIQSYHPNEIFDKNPKPPLQIGLSLNSSYKIIEGSKGMAKSPTYQSAQQSFKQQLGIQLLKKCEQKMKNNEQLIQQQQNNSKNAFAK